jgi:hypothetical protein
VRLTEIVFGVPLLVGVLLVVCSALGAAELSADFDHSFDQADADGDSLLGVLGVGRVPLVIVTMLLALLFGGVGLALTATLNPVWGERAAFLLTLPTALAAALAGTALCTRLLERVLPDTETYAPRGADLVGLPAIVLVKLGSGEVIARVRDPGGAEQRVRCLVSGVEVEPGDELILLSFEAEHHVFGSAKRS